MRVLCCQCEKVYTESGELPNPQTQTLGPCSLGQTVQQSEPLLFLFPFLKGHTQSKHQEQKGAPQQDTYGSQLVARGPWGLPSCSLRLRPVSRSLPL